MLLCHLASRSLAPRLSDAVRARPPSSRPLVEMVRYNSDMAKFREVFSKAKHIAIITGAGVSAESGIPTFRGNLFKTHCISCGSIKANHKSPICPALLGKGAPDPVTSDARIPVNDLPRCEDSGCNGLLRPDVVWFGETLDSNVLTQVEKELDMCDLCLVVGTSSVVYPAAMFGPQVASRRIPVVEFNTNITPKTTYFTHHIRGPCGTTLPLALARHESEVI
ncbi:hypothetical protein AALO_G00018170 [Alosa alosa]|uniref:Deacetylase sirtuin-type domain-containing protein n=1 Tax=Alosa alosa TaxID=278164 RepID=A0AAV6HH80_9TELE|nr:hypothetical protein AALO_G00018170 [Alosa alosa]